MGTNKSLVAFAIGVVCLLAFAGTVAQADPIETGSPGGLERISRVAQSCPTFSWGLVQDASGYELVVYRLPDSEDSGTVLGSGVDPEGDALPELRTSVPAGVSAWTPSLDRCLDAEGSYAWLVRPVFAQGEGEWSEARMFSIERTAAQGDLRRVLEEMVEEYLEKRDRTLGAPVRRRPDSAVPTVAGPLTAGLPEGAEAGLPLDGRSGLRGELPPPVPSEITFGLRGIVENTFAGSAGVLGESTAATGVTHGVRGITLSGSGTSSGVLGESSTGVTYGVQGVTTSDSPDARGVLGRTFAENGVAVEGNSSNPAGIGVGVRGTAAGAGARGVEGVASDGGSGVTYGVRGTTFSSAGRGVFGLASSTGGGRGVAGAAVADTGYGGYFENTSGSSESTALFATSASGRDLELGGTGRVKVPATNMIVEGGRLEADLECTGCIESKEILDETIAAVDIATSAVTTDEILDDTILAADIDTGAVTSDEILDETIVAGDIATSAVTSDEILNETIVAADIATSAVTSDEILNETIVAADIATGAVTTDEILNGTILGTDISPDAVMLGTQTVGDYVRDVISSGGLKLSPGGEGALVGLVDCTANQVLKWTGPNTWICATGDSNFASIETGTNTSATMTLGGTSSLVSDGGNIEVTSSGAIVGTDGAIPMEGVVDAVLDDAFVVIKDVAVLSHTTTGAAVSGLGTGLMLRSENNAGGTTDVGRLTAELTSVAAASENSTLKLWAKSSGALNPVVTMDHLGKVTATSFSGDGSLLTGVTASGVAPNSVVLGADTTGSYADGVGEGGAATTGDSATAFFTSGAIEPARGGTGLDTSAVGTGSIFYAPSSGTWATLPVGSDGEVLKLAGGLPSWAADSDSGGTVTSVGSGAGLKDGPITTTGALAVDETAVPFLDLANTFTKGQSIAPTGVDAEVLVVKAAATQTANLQEWQSSGGTALATMAADGTFSAKTVNLDVPAGTFILPVETSSPACTYGTLYVKDNAATGVDALCVCMDSPDGGALELVSVTGGAC